MSNKGNRKRVVSRVLAQKLKTVKPENEPVWIESDCSFGTTESCKSCAVVNCGEKGAEHHVKSF